MKERSPECSAGNRPNSTDVHRGRIRLATPGDSQMNQYEYTAQCEGGAAISGTLEAQDGTEAAKQLNSMGLRNIDLREAERAPSRRPLGSDDFIFFNDQLASLAESGLALDQGLREIAAEFPEIALYVVTTGDIAGTYWGIPEAAMARVDRLVSQAVAAQDGLDVLFSGAADSPDGPGARPSGWTERQDIAGRERSS